MVGYTSNYSVFPEALTQEEEKKYVKQMLNR